MEKVHRLHRCSRSEFRKRFRWNFRFNNVTRCSTSLRRLAQWCNAFSALGMEGCRFAPLIDLMVIYASFFLGGSRRSLYLLFLAGTGLFSTFFPLVVSMPSNRSLSPNGLYCLHILLSHSHPTNSKPLTYSPLCHFCTYDYIAFPHLVSWRWVFFSYIF